VRIAKGLTKTMLPARCHLNPCYSEKREDKLARWPKVQLKESARRVRNAEQGKSLI